MLRRLTNICLLPLLLIPSAALKHQHEDEQSAGHEFRPHFHSSFVGDSHSHSHGEQSTANHAHTGGNSHGNLDHQDSPKLSAAPACADDFDMIAEHDRNAIYLNSGGEFANAGIAPGEDSDSLVDCVTWVGSPDCGLHAPPARGSLRAHQPSNSGYVCPLFVRHLSLLI